MEIPGLTLNYDVAAKGDRELTESDIVYSELHVAVVALSSVIAERHNLTGADMFEYLVEIGKGAAASLEDKKG